MVKALLQSTNDFKEYMKKYRENNKDKIYELQQKSYNCPYCDRENIHVYYKTQHEKTKYCQKRRKGSPIESLKTVQLINQITD